MSGSTLALGFGALSSSECETEDEWVHRKQEAEDEAEDEWFTAASGLQMQELSYGEWFTSASGLQMQELSYGGGEPAKKGETVCVHYTGYIMSAKGWEIFDSSRSRNEPLEFPLGAGCVLCRASQLCNAIFFVTIAAAGLSVACEARLFVPLLTYLFSSPNRLSIDVF
jgi:hypothetical protein